MISAEIPQKGRAIYSITECLEEFSKEKVVTEVDCPRCSVKGDHTRRCLIEKVTYILALHIKRWSREGQMKRNDRINIKQNLDLSKYMYK